MYSIYRQHVMMNIHLYKYNIKRLTNEILFHCLFCPFMIVYTCTLSVSPVTR